MSESTQRTLAGRYEVGEFIGQGGMSTVYRGVDTKLGRQVAIKIMKADLASDDDFRNRFRQEARAASRMAHPSIVRVFDAGDDLIQTANGTQRLPFIVMEYVEGKNLRQLIAEKPLSQTEASRVVEAVLGALDYSHRAGIVHRDIKPANIMITTAGHVKVMDFGIARAVSETTSTVQQTTAILGTAAYFSPEQAKGETVDARTDLYSTGVVLYELLVGEVPFRGDTAVAVAYQHVSERPRVPSERNPAVPPAFDRVIMHALAKDRAKRFQTASEFKEALSQAAQGRMPDLAHHVEAEHAPTASSDELAESDLVLRQLTERSSKRQARPPVVWTWVAILTVIAVVASVGFWIASLRPPSAATPETRTIPELTSIKRDDAMETLRALGLVPVAREEPDDDVSAGGVIRTDPESGVTVDTGAQVTVYVSTGPVEAEVPNLVRLSLKDATDTLKRHGFVLGLTETVDDASAPAGTVLSSDPAAEETRLSGSEVDIRISSGKVEIPDVVGQTMQAANLLLGDLDLTVRQIPDTSCPLAQNLPIIYQSLVGRADQRSEIEIYYCAG